MFEKDNNKQKRGQSIFQKQISKLQVWQSLAAKVVVSNHGQSRLKPVLDQVWVIRNRQCCSCQTLLQKMIS